MAQAREQIEKIRALDSRDFKIYTAINLEDSLRSVESKQIKNYTDCPSAHLRTLVCPSGVFVCPYWRGKEPFMIGDAKYQPMQEIWNSDRRARVMDDLDPSKVCNFHCLRNETNLEVFRIINGGDIQVTDQFDRFI